MDTTKMKKQATDLFEKSKNWIDEKLSSFNDLSLMNKIIIIIILHYGLRFFKKESSSDKSGNKYKKSDETLGYK